MRINILSNVQIKEDWIKDLKEYIDCEIKISYTEEILPGRWNPYFREVWGDFKWIRERIKTGDVKAFVTSLPKLQESKINSVLGLYDMADGDGIIDLYIALPNVKKLDTRAKLNGFKNNFTYLFIHELLHGKEQNAGFKDAVHAMDEQGRLKEMLTKHLERDELEKQVGLLQRILELTKILFSLKKKPKVVTDLLPLVKRQSDMVIAAMGFLGLPVRVVEGYRSPERQTELYNQGRTTKGNIVTNAKAGESLHNFGVAVDFVFRKQGYNATKSEWKLLGDIGKAHGFDWGGDFKNFIDKPHHEMKLGYSLKDFQNGKIDYTKFN